MFTYFPPHAMEVLKGYTRMIYQLPKGGRSLSGKVKSKRKGKDESSAHGHRCSGKHRNGPPEWAREQIWETRCSAGGHLSLERHKCFHNSSAQNECPFLCPTNPVYILEAALNVGDVQNVGLIS